MFINVNLPWVSVYGFKGCPKHVMYIYGFLGICEYLLRGISYVWVYIDSNLHTNIFVVMRMVCKLISME